MKTVVIVFSVFENCPAVIVVENGYLLKGKRISEGKVPCRYSFSNMRRCCFNGKIDEYPSTIHEKLNPMLSCIDE